MDLHRVHAAHSGSTRVDFNVKGDSISWRGDSGQGAFHKEKEKMARRLAVCWNICEGYPTEALEAGILPDVYEATCALLKYAEKQWDPQMAKLCANLRKALKTETDAIDFRDGRLNDCDSPACRR